MVNLNGLNDAQMKAVTSESNKICLLAGAGSGKTKVVTTRIAYLNDHRISCNNILALTFTRNSGREMKERIIKLIGKKEASKLSCGTFHAFCVRVLKEHGKLLGYGSEFTIYDEEDCIYVIDSIIKELSYKTTPKKVYEYMMLDPIKDYTHMEELSTKEPDILSAIKEYEYRLKQNNAMDFEGILSNVIELFTKYPEVLDYYHRLYEYVFIDEYQDTNNIQWKLITLINPLNIFVVGDDNQSLYGWRGANIDLILGLSINPEWEVIKLELNYRSTKPIIEASNNIIKLNKQTEKKLISCKDGDPIHFIEGDDEEFEARRIASEIQGLSGKYSDKAIIARTNKQLETIKRAFDAFGIPSLIVSNKDDPFKKDDIKKIIGYLTLFMNPYDNFTFKKIINFPRQRLTELQLRQVELVSTTHECNLLSALSKMNSSEYDRSIVDGFEMLEEMGVGDMDADDAFEKVVESLAIKGAYVQQGRANRITDIEEAVYVISKWVDIQVKLGENTTMSYFLKWLKLKDIQERLTEESDTVKIMTIHAAKGLEFPAVFVIGLNQGVLPSSKGDIEEERRLMYVAMTRAKDLLYLTRPKVFVTWGTCVKFSIPSQFLSEI